MPNAPVKKSCLDTVPPPVRAVVVILIIGWLAALGFDKAFQAGIAWKSLRHWQNPVSNSDTIAVSAEGKVTAIPDVGVINLSVESRGKTVAQVQADNTKKINQVIDFLKSKKVESKDIRTTQYNLYPTYTYQPQTGRQSLDGYQLTQSVEAKVRALDSVGDILAGSLEQGANQVGQLSFTIDDPEVYQQLARLQAIQKARAKAEVLAQAAGVRLGKVRSFSENVNTPPPYPIPYATGIGMMADNKMAAPEVQAGSQDVTVNVSLSFEID